MKKQEKVTINGKETLILNLDNKFEGKDISIDLYNGYILDTRTKKEIGVIRDQNMNFFDILSHKEAIIILKKFKKNWRWMANIY